MSAVYIKTRQGPKGRRWLVYFRRGGRGFPEEYGGSFKNPKDARARRDLISGELAAGRDPRLVLADLRNPPAPPPGLDEHWGDYIAGRVDWMPKSIEKAELARRHWTRILGPDRNPATITPNLIVAGIAELSKTMVPGTVGQYLSGLAQALDHADVYPNPARSPKVRLPRADKEEINPPTSKEWAAIRARLRVRSRLLFLLVECCGLRISEAVALRHGDIDYVDGRLRIARTRTKTASGHRWIPVPPELLDGIADTCPPEDRTTDRRIFTFTNDKARYDLQRACMDAGVISHSPHDLRHRRISLWLRLGIDAVQVSRWAGHARTSMSLDTYGHVVVDPAGDEWAGFWRETYRAERTVEEVPAPESTVRFEREALTGHVNGETYAETEARLVAGPEGQRDGRAQATPVKVIDNALTRARRKIYAALDEAA